MSSHSCCSAHHNLAPCSCIKECCSPPVVVALLTAAGVGPAAPFPHPSLCSYAWQAPVKPCCRPDYLRQTLDSLSQLAGLERMAVYISQDGDNSAVAAVVQGFAADALAPPRTRAFQHWQRKRNPQLGAHQASVLLAGVLSCIWLAMPECVC